MANTNVASLLNPSILNNIKNSQGIRTFGDQQTNTNQQTQISGNTPTLTNLLQTKKSLIQEEIDLDLKHQQKLLQLQQITPSSLTTDNLPYPPKDYSEANLQKYDEEYVKFYNNYYATTSRLDDGIDFFLGYKTDNLPKIQVPVKEWRAKYIEGGIEVSWDAQQYPTLEKIYAKDIKAKQKVDQGKLTVPVLFEGFKEKLDGETKGKISLFIRDTLVPRNINKIKSRQASNIL
jgi:hypothetical protein